MGNIKGMYSLSLLLHSPYPPFVSPSPAIIFPSFPAPPPISCSTFHSKPYTLFPSFTRSFLFPFLFLSFSRSSDLSEASLLRAIPRFKLQSEGDPIRLNDQVVFESGLKPGESKTYVNAAKSNKSSASSKVTSSSKKTFGVRLRLFARYNISSDAFKHVLKGGDYIRILHREANGFLCAYRNPDNTYRVALRQIPSSIERDQIHDFSSLWQVELSVNDRRGGRPIVWNDIILLKNVLTGRMLTISREGEIKLEGLVSREDHLIRFSSVMASSQEDGEDSGQGSEPIQFTSFFYVHTAATIQRDRRWLHVEYDEAAHKVMRVAHIHTYIYLFIKTSMMRFKNRPGT